MFDIDRPMYEAFAAGLQLDPEWAAELIDGSRQAGPELARALAIKTNGKPTTWTREGKGPARLIAVKLWWLKQQREAA